MPKFKRNRNSFRTPKPRRIKKWRTRVFRLIHRAHPRGFRWFMSEMFRCLPLIQAAKARGVDLSQEVATRFGGPGPVDEEALLTFMLGRRHQATKRNLEI